MECSMCNYSCTTHHSAKRTAGTIVELLHCYQEYSVMHISFLLLSPHAVCDVGSPSPGCELYWIILRMRFPGRRDVFLLLSVLYRSPKEEN